MILRDLLVRTGMRASESMERLTKILRLKRSRARQLELVSMEDRLLFSAAPGPMPVAPAPDAQIEMVVAASLDAAVEVASSGQSDQFESSTPAQGLQARGFDSVLEATTHELVFIDTGAENYQALLDDLWSHQDPARQIDVVLLSAKEDGLAQITETLSQYTTEKLDAVHLVTHGADRAIKLGNTWLDAASLDQNRDQIASWGEALQSGADLLIYGCDLAGNDLGRALLNNLVDLTGADIAASIDDTGSSLLGGDWDLEYEVGEVDTQVAFSGLLQSEWNALLQNLPIQATERHELVFVDTSVDGYEQIVDDLVTREVTGTRFEVILLDPQRDGISQIGETLASRTGIDAIHIVSHGTDGRVLLGDVVLDAESLKTRTVEIAAWSNSLSSEADMLLYGCDVAIDGTGRNLVDELARLTGADVAASSDATGHIQLGGDWDLEYRAGQVDTNVAISAAFQDQWVELLPTYQQFTNYTAEVEVNSDANQAQTFTHTSGSGTYVVNQLSLAMRRESSGYSSTYTVTLRSSWNGAILATSGPIASSSLGTSLAFVDVNFGNVTLTDGTTYTIRVTTNDTNGKVYAGFNSSGGYSGGNRLDTAGSPIPIEDLAFKVASTATQGVTVDASSNAATDGVTSLNVAHTTSGTNRLMLVSVATDPHGESVSSITYNGISLTRVGIEELTGNHSRVEIWSLLAPSTGTHNVVVTMTGTGYNGVAVGVMTFNGVNQTTPLLDFDTASGSSTVAAVTVASATDDLVFGALHSHNGAGVAPDAGQTEYWDVFSGQSNGSGSGKAGATTVTSSWTVNNDDWSAAAVSIQADTNTAVVVSASVAKDAYIRASDPTTNYGLQGTMVVDRESGDLQRALVQFDLSAIPANATIVSATLSLQATAIGGTLNIAAYQLQQPWDETGVTWNQSSSGVDWSVAGGAYNATALDTVTTDATGQHAWDITSLAQAWVASTQQNYGIMVASPDGGGDRTATYDSREGAVQPVLEIIYFVSNTPPGATNLSSAETYTEDSALNLTDIVISDVDSANVTATLTLSDVAAGSLNTGTSGAVTSTYNAGTGVWTASGAIANVNTLLAGLTFTPALNFNSNFTIATNVSDGVAAPITGSKAMTGAAVNDAPTIANAVTLVMTGTNEDTPSSPTTVSSLLSSVTLAYTDVDSGALSGMAITAATGGGNWQYSTDGLAWVEIGSVSTTNALLLDSSTQLRFNPDGQNGGSATIVFQAWDRTTGTASTNALPAFANPGLGGGTTAFSSASANLQLTVTSVNDSPTISGGSLTSILEDATNPAGATISSLIASSFFDVDAGDSLSGIAVTSNNALVTEGAWQYSTDSGTNWFAIGSVGVNGLALNVGTRVRFVPAVDFNGSPTIISLRGLDNSYAGGFTSGVTRITVDTTSPGGTSPISSSLESISTTVTAVNDAPALTAGSLNNLTVLEDSGLTSLGLGGLSFGKGGGSDEASQSLSFQVTTIPHPTFFGVVYLADGTTPVAVGTYSLAQIQGMQFRPATDRNGGPSFFGFQVVDTGGTSNGGADTTAYFIQLDITPANDAPVISLSGGTQTYTEGGSPVLWDMTATVSDLDSTDFSGGTLTASIPTNASVDDRIGIRNEGVATGQIGVSTNEVTFGGVLIGTFTGGTNGSTPLVVTLNSNATVAAVQTLARNITFSNVSESPSTATRLVRIVVTDGVGGTSNNGQNLLNVVGVNDAPTVTLTTTPVNYTENGSVSIDSLLSLADVDSTTLTGATIQITGNYVSSQDQLNYTNMLGISGSWSGATGTLTLSGTTTVADYQMALRTITYLNSSDAPNTAQRTFSLSVTDGTTPSVSATRNINITLVNDTPTITTNTLSISEGGTVVLSSANMASSDPDNTAAQLTYSTASISGGQFELVATPGVAITVFTQAQINAGAVRFVHNGGETAPSYALTVSDGSLSNGPVVVSIGTFTSANDAPVFATNTLAITEGAAIVLTNAHISATDSDNTPAQLTYTASSLSNGQFELIASPGAAISSFTQAQINAGAVRFVHDGGEVAPGYTLTVNDGALSSSPIAMTLSAFANINDAPVITAPASVSITASQASPFTGPNTLQVSDSDATTLDVTITVSNGGFSLSQTTGLTFTTGDGLFDSVMQFSGSLSNLNAALSNARYQYTAGHGATESLTIDVSDLGQSGTGGTRTASSTTTLAIAMPTTVVGDAFLQGSYLEVGLGQNGAIGSDGASPVGFNSSGGLLGVVVDNERDGWSTFDGDFITPGSPEETWGLHVGGTTYSNANSLPNEITGGLVNYQSSPSGQVVEWLGNQSGLQVLQTYSVGANNLFMDVEVALTNLSGAALSDVYYYRNVDPDNNVNQGSVGGFATTNTIVSQGNSKGVSLVTATQSDGSYLGLLGFGENSRVTYGGFANRDPLGIYQGTGGLNQSGSNYADQGVSLAFQYATIASGETVSLRFRYYFGSSDANIPVVDLDADNSRGDSGGDFTASFTEGGGPVGIVDADATVMSPSGVDIDGMQVLITNLLDGSSESLAVNTAGTSIVAGYNSTTGVLTLSGAANDADYRTVLRTLTYDNTSTNPNATTRSVSIVATSGANDSVPVTSYVLVNAVNNGPTINANTLTLSEGQTVVLTTAQLYSSDPDSSAATLTYSISGLSGGQFENTTAPGVAISSFTQADINSGLIQFVHNGGEAAPTYQVTVSDSSLSNGPSPATIIFGNVNDAPTISAIANQAINEDATLGPIAFTVGDAETVASALVVTATSSDGTLIPNGNIVVGGTGASRTVTITPALNQNGGPVTITLTVSDGGLSTQTTFQIIVDAVNDAPVISVLPDQSVDEDTTLSPIAFTVSDAESVATSLSLTATSSDQSLIPHGNIVISGTGANRTITISPTADLNGGPVTITLTVSDGTLSTQATFQVVVNPINDAPTISVVPDQTIDEDTTTGPLAITVGDIDSSVNGLVVTAISSDQGLIPDGNLILSGTGASRTITVTPAADQNGGPVTITLTVSDGALTTLRTFMVNLSPVNDLPIINPQGFTVDENSVAGALVGTVIATDIDAGAVLAYAIDSGNDNGAFAINASTGEITVANSGALDFETSPVYLLTVSVTDNVSTPQTTTITIRLLDLNEVPTSLDLSHNPVDENSSVGTLVGQLSSTDVDAGDSAAYSLVDDAGGLFTVDANTGEITVNGPLDFETSVNHTIVARITDAGGLVLDRSFVISLVDLNEAPVLVGGAFVLPENSPYGNLVATISASDVDAGDQLTFSLISGNTSGAFSIDANTGAITVANTAAIDFETNGTFMLTAQVADRAGLIHQQLVTVTLSDVNERPTVLAGTYHINEWSSVGSLVGVVAASDVDAGDTLSYSFVAGNTGGRFTIDPSTGDITVANGVGFTHETQSTYTITVQVQDAAGLTHTADMRLVVDNVNEPPVAVNDEYTMNQFEVLTTATINGLLANDSDSDSISMTASLVDGPQNGTLVLNADGTFTYMPDDLYFGRNSFTYIVHDGLESSSVAIVSLTVNLVAPGGGGLDGDSNFLDEQDDVDVTVDEEETNDEATDDEPTDTDESSEDSRGTSTSENNVSTPSDAAAGNVLLQTANILDDFFHRNISLIDLRSGARHSSGPRLGLVNPVRRLPDLLPVIQELIPAPLQDLTYAILENHSMWKELNNIRHQMEDQQQSSIFAENIVVGTTTAVTGGLTVGYVLWLIRGGSLLATMVSVIPSWASFDPLPVMDRFEEEKSEEDEESLASIVSGT